MQGGTSSLPKEQVLRVEAGDSNLAEYLRRKEALKKSPAARAADWLELARWARAKELDQATREAALAAATLDPQARRPGAHPARLRLRPRSAARPLGPLRRLDAPAGLRARGRPVDHPRGVPGAGSGRRRRTQTRHAAARQEAARAAREDRLAALAELSVVRQLGQRRAPAGYPYPAYGNPYGLPVVAVPRLLVERRRRDGRRTAGRGAPHHRSRRRLLPSFTHIPGSLIRRVSRFPDSTLNPGRTPSRSRISARPIPAASRRCAASRSPSVPARCSPCWDRTAPASRPPSAS